jgi:hypothetical protein
MDKKSEKLIECVICHKVMIPEFGPNSNNAAPVVYDGRCCDLCNSTVVIPARITRMRKGEGPY